MVNCSELLPPASALEDEELLVEDEAPVPAASPDVFGAVSQAASRPNAANKVMIRTIIGITPQNSVIFRFLISIKAHIP
jgi:hypothetical protein